MVCDCIVYRPDPRRNPDLLDVASYDLDCPIHGWRWDYDGKILSLEEYYEIDEANIEKLGLHVAYDNNANKLIFH